MSEIIQLMPCKWVSESVLMTITGMKKNTIKAARDNCWMEMREYKHVSPNGEPQENSACFYNWKLIERWIESQPPATPRQRSA
ncbi:excisionase family protein [Lelliottia amnigena]|uniref:excisionase family protein n=1 Tax=Lelliottia amnigena TaxID=61646 RepID=UPI0020900879|nr:excisionase family protein [Lelliottia amnigena]USR61579.1 excisionase family protein [Lelliottia amnigena]